MTRRGQCKTQPIQRQRGAVAIIVALSLVLLVGLLGLVIDLGHLYVAKTELQNAADAAALSGAKQLDGTLCGVDSTGCALGKIGAVQRAIEAAGKNKYDLNAKAATITKDNLWVGSCPDQDRPSEPDTDGCTMVTISSVTTDALAADKTFLQVDTDPPPAGLSRSLSTWFIQVLSTATTNMQTFGMAVAGRFVVNLTPLGVCAIDPATRGGVRDVNGTHELTEFGFRRGVAYNIPELNPLGAPRDPLFINPVAVPGGPVACQGSQGAANFTAPFVCAGNSAAIPATLPGGRVYVNTGVSASLVRAFNSRFENPEAGSGPSPCDVGTAPPDTNKKEYNCTHTPGQPNPTSCLDTPGLGAPQDWMDTSTPPITIPSRQTITLIPGTPVVSVDFPNINPPLGFGEYGVLWSYSRAVRAVGASPNATASTDSSTVYTPADWATLYPGGSADYPLAASIPPFPVGTLPAPYNQASGNYYQPPTILPPGKKDRRVLNIAILDCTGYVGGAICSSTLPMMGIGKFFMQREADLSGSTRRIEGEFAGLIDPVLTGEVKLYR